MKENILWAACRDIKEKREIKGISKAARVKMKGEREIKGRSAAVSVQIKERGD
jgi:hypothetical protein